MSRFVVVLPLVSLQPGDRFAVEDWPLHITLVPNFSADASVETFIADLAAASRSHASFTVSAGQDELFGPLANIPVTIIDDSPTLTVLHRALVATFRAHGASFDTPAFVDDGYRAHVTITKHARAVGGEDFRLRQLAFVDMEPEPSTDYRAVIATFLLAGPVG